MTWDKRVKHPSKIVDLNAVVQAVVLDIDPQNKRISLGMKQLLPNPWDIIEDKFPVGTVVTGPVRNITDFGIFVGVDDGIDGLVHISDLSWSQRVKHPSERYKRGDDVRARVMSIDREGERLSLSVKDLAADPWEGIEGRYYAGMAIAGKIVSVADFGVFVELEEGIEGLIHKTELVQEDHLGEYKIGEAIQAEVLSIEPIERKIGLTELVEGEQDSGRRPEPQRPVRSSLGDMLSGAMAEQLAGMATDQGDALAPAATDEDE